MKKTGLFIIILIYVTLMTSCGGGSDQPTAAPPAPAESNNSEGSIEKPGTTDSFSLLFAPIGLNTFTSYRQELTLTFEGTRSGTPYSAIQEYQLTIDHANNRRALVQSHKDEAGEIVTESTIISDDLAYFIENDTCNGDILAEATLAFEPASLLPSIIGATPSGSEALEGLTASIYPLNATVINAPDGAAVSGNVWIAEDSGVVLRYELILEGSAETFGEGFAGVQTWTYVLSQINSAAVDIPVSCPSVLTGLPVPGTAQSVQFMPGMTSYLYNGSPADIGGFYFAELKAAGWEQYGEPYLTEEVSKWIFTRLSGGHREMLLVQVFPEGEGLLVQAMQLEKP